MNVKKIKSLVISIKRRVDRRRNVIGVVEYLGFGMIKGWVVVRNNTAKNITIVLKVREYKSNVFWSERKDIVRDHQCYGDNNGFEARFPRELCGELVRNPHLLQKLRVRVNGKAIKIFRRAIIEQPFVSDDRQRATPVSGQGLGAVDVGSGQLTLGLIGVEGFIVYGWWQGRDQSVTEMGISLNNEYYPCTALFEQTTQADLPVSLTLSGIPQRANLFELELPGYMWMQLEKKDQVIFQIVVNTTAVLEPQFLITADHVCDWLVDIASGVYGADQFWHLLALEHLHHIGDAVVLPEKLSHYYQQCAEGFGLIDYVHLEQTDNVRAAVKPLSVHINFQNALRAFNQALITAEETLSTALDRVVAEFDIVGSQRDAFLLCLVPYFCSQGEFSVLEKRIQNYADFEEKDKHNAWNLSRGLPFLQAAGKYKQLLEVLGYLETADGWMNTECVSHVVKVAVSDIQAANNIEVSAQVISVFLELLRKLGLDYWSRLHDNNLMQALISCLKIADRLDDQLQKNVIRSALSRYGLSVNFWKAIERESIHHLFPELLLESRIVFIRLDELLTDRSAWLVNYGEILGAIKYFIRLWNPEGIVALREFVTNVSIFHNDQKFPKDLHSLALGYLLDWNHFDVVRIAASPVGLGSFVNTRASMDTRAVVRNLIEVSSRAPKYELQFAVSRALVDLNEALTMGVSVEPMLSHALELAGGLNGWQDGYLYLDVLGIIARLLGEKSEPSLFEYYSNSLDKAVEACGTQSWPYASITGSQFIISELLKNNPVSLLRVGEKAAGQGVFADTLVVVYSCRMYLDSRIEEIRNSWLKNLDKYGIPYLVLVGDGDNSIQGDVLALDVSDKYEHLPQKSLKLVEWVYKHTDYQYLIKVDDDCFLNVDQYFGSMSYRKFHYYGRRLNRGYGGTDRQWHNSKSTTPKARLSLDKSPEPSQYADGGTGYSLSRLAMQKILSANETEQGGRLVGSSYMEDKMIGDLLAMGNIAVADEDYYTLVRRRTFPEATPVSMYANNFYPSIDCDIKLVHLDAAGDMEAIRQLSLSPGLYPRKIWPGFTQLNSQSLKFGAQNMQLELLSSSERLARLENASLVVIAGVFNESMMLPHFLAHYRELGVESFVFVDNLSADGGRELLLQQDDVVLYSVDGQYRNSHYGVAWQQAVLANHCLGKWVLVADADEFIVYPGCEEFTLPEYVASLDRDGYDAACLYMVDMYPDGDLSGANFAGQSPFSVAKFYDTPPLINWRLSKGFYSDSSHMVSSFRHRIMPDAEPTAYTSQKFALFRYRPWIKLSDGLHFVTNIKVAPEPIAFAHFKYHAGFEQKAAVEAKRKQHYKGAKEYLRYQELLAELKGGFREQNVSSEYINSHQFISSISDGCGE